MIHIIKILFLIFPLFIISCDAECDGNGIDEGACDCEGNVLDECGECGGNGINEGACDCEGNVLDECGECNGGGIAEGTCDCEGTLPTSYCIDNDGDGLGNPDSSTDFCIDNIPENWISDCSDELDECDGELDECSVCDGENADQDCTGECFGDALVDECEECNGNNQSKDCNEICFGTAVLDDSEICCDNQRIQYSDYSHPFNGLSTCLPDTFKWSLKMMATMGDYNDNIFTSSADSVSNYFTIGTHYLSTDGLDILEDMAYSDIVQPPSTVENSIYFYTAHPEWEYEFGNNFIQEYKFHDIEEIQHWEGEMSSDYYGEKFISIKFELEADNNIHSGIEFSLNSNEPVVSPNCLFYFSNNESDIDDPCNILNEEFEYIVPIIFQGAGYSMPFTIGVYDTYIYQNIPEGQE